MRDGHTTQFPVARSCLSINTSPSSFCGAFRRLSTPVWFWSEKKSALDFLSTKWRKENAELMDPSYISFYRTTATEQCA